MTNSRRDARIDLAAAHRLAVFDGLNEGTWNHFSLILPDDPRLMLVSPAACHWKQVTASSLILIDFQDGTKIEGTGECDPAAFCIHYPTPHACCPQAACVL